MARVARSAVFGRVVCLCAVVALGAGCTALPRLETAVFQDPLLEHKGTVPLKAAMMTLTDARPAEEREGRGAIEDFAERVTVVMLTDLSEARVFTSIEREDRAGRRRRDPARRDPLVPVVSGVQPSPVHPRARHPRSLRRPRVARDDGCRDHPRARGPEEGADHRVLHESRPREPVALRLPVSGFSGGSDRDSNSALRRVAVDLQMAILEDRQQIVEALK